MRAALFHVAVSVGRGGHFRGRRFGVIIIGLLLVGGVITLAILLYRSKHRQVTITQPSTPSVPAPWTAAANAESILSERFARGEMTMDEFVAARNALRGGPMPTPPQSTNA